jgi:hypothetical protein
MLTEELDIPVLSMSSDDVIRLSGFSPSAVSTSQTDLVITVLSFRETAVGNRVFGGASGTGVLLCGTFSLILRFLPP